MTSGSSSLPRSRGVVGEYRAFFAFLVHARPPESPQAPTIAALFSTLKLWPLTLALALLGGLPFISLELAGADLPDNVLADLSLARFVTVAVLIAPLVEELIFRSWLSPRPAWLAFGALFVLGLAGASVAAAAFGPPGGFIAGAGGLLLGLIAYQRLRHRPASPFVRRRFRWFYLAGTVAFALIHLGNLSTGPSGIGLILVMPQFMAGLVMGYARIINGLWSSMLLHALYNGTLVGGLALALRFVATS